jgi:transcriptional regulator with XRE-family HTH domain
LRRSEKDLTDPAVFLGQQLAKMRAAAGYETQEEFARAPLGLAPRSTVALERSTISKIETGDRPPTPPLLATWLKACGKGLEDLIKITCEMARVREQPIPPWFKDYFEAEGLAWLIRCWHPVVIPGLAQTEDYARDLIVKLGDDSVTTEKLVKIRMTRQQILERPSPPDVRIVFDESVLQRQVGSPEIMSGQMRRLVELGERPNISMQIVPLAAGANAGSGGGFHIASIDGKADVLIAEAVEDVTTDKRLIVRRANQIWERIRSDALPQSASMRMIREAEETWTTRAAAPGGSPRTADLTAADASR